MSSDPERRCAGILLAARRRFCKDCRIWVRSSLHQVVFLIGRELVGCVELSIEINRVLPFGQCVEVAQVEPEARLTDQVLDLLFVIEVRGRVLLHQSADIRC